MHLKNINLRHGRTRIWLAVLAVAMLAGGATWQGFAADIQASMPQAAAVVTSPAVATGRDSYADVVKVVSPAVVTVRVQSRPRMTPTDSPQDDFLRRFFGDRFGEQFGSGPRGMPAPARRGLGSGVVVSADGYILTNHHVIDDAEAIQVDLTDGRTLDAKLVGSDRASDLAVLKIDASNLHALKLGDSDAVQVGDVVLAVGNPLGIGQTVTMGIVSAKGRSTAGVGDGSYEDFLQTDAAINQGNSGGALVNTKGDLIGINSQILSPSGGNIGIGFAIPANMVRDVMNDLRRDGRVRRAQLGVTIQPVTSDIAESLGLKEVRGAIVSAVESGSAADKAGIARGDVITAFNGQPVQDLNSLRNRVAAAQPGSDATVTVVRSGGERTLPVKLNEAAASQAARAADAPDNQAALGIAVAPLTPDLAARAGLPRDTKGLIVQEVNPGSRAEAAGIEPGDVIQEVNRKPVDSVDALRAEVRSSMSRPLLFLVSREGRTLFVTVRPS